MSDEEVLEDFFAKKDKTKKPKKKKKAKTSETVVKESEGQSVQVCIQRILSNNSTTRNWKPFSIHNEIIFMNKIHMLNTWLLLLFRLEFKIFNYS